MKVLVITRNAWDDTNAIGNTLTNFFDGIDDIEFAAIYFRNSMPDNYLCKNYYQTSEIELIRKWFSPGKIGRQFYYDRNSQKETTQAKTQKEKTLIRVIQKYGIELAYKISDYLWYSEKWINANLKNFVESFSPDLIVTFAKSAPQYYLTVKFLRENYKIPLFSWVADDEYTGLLKKGCQREIKNLHYILNESAVVKGCSEEICDYYNGIFGCNATPLYKSCVLSEKIKKSENDTVTVVYAGNLLYGRLEIIRNVADALEKFSSEGMKISFEIYSNTALLPHEAEEYFGKNSSTRYMGRKDYDYIKERLSAADIVLHAESFDEDQMLKTKYSFSTKIIDYLQSGSVILAVGPEEISSMKYISRIPGACVINDMDKLNVELSALLDDRMNFYQRAQKSRMFAKEYHDSDIESEKLKETLNQIIAGRD